jgi:hypothetical protein
MCQSLSIPIRGSARRTVVRRILVSQGIAGKRRCSSSPDAQATVEFIGHLLVEAPLLLERPAACEIELDEDVIGRTLDPHEVGIDGEVRRGAR